MMRIREMLEELLAKHTNRPVAEIGVDIERDKILTAKDAVEYGIIDQVLASRKASK
jgi:ATP-dependent Clp protease protease subunit